ncbi:acid phosphatase [Colletotrichum camelliae]|nr:acid phosphatase [Colletotrichum camelliae]
MYPPRLQLKLVQVFFRHGERTPHDNRFQNASSQLATLGREWAFNASAKAPKALFEGPASKFVPIDDEIEKPLLPDGRKDICCHYGELTDNGRATATELGRELRKLYVEQLGFMPPMLNNIGMIYLRSTQYQRTFVSLQHVFRGLYPPDVVDQSLQGILVFVEDPKHESLLPPEDYSERFSVLLRQFSERAAIKWDHSLEMEQIKARLAPWMPGSVSIGVDSQPVKLHDIHDTISAVAATPEPGQFLPLELLDPGLRSIMEKICAEEEFAGYAHNKEFRRLGVGKMLQEALQRMFGAKRQGQQTPTTGQIPPGPRMFLLACHDSAIAGALASLGAMGDPEWHWPPYAAHIAIELFCNVEEHAMLGKTTTAEPKSWYVRLKYQGKPVVLPCGAGKDNHLPGHEDFCTFEALRGAIEEFAPVEGHALDPAGAQFIKKL